MKSTTQRLGESYCKPQTEEEWAKFGLIPLSGHYVAWLGGEPTLISGKFRDRTEIPVPHFIDLTHDRLAPWRLEEDGFTTLGGLVYSKRFTMYSEDGKITRRVTVVTDTGRVYLGEGPTNVTSYTDLLTLIRLIG
jgi:hypothetical protein